MYSLNVPVPARVGRLAGKLARQLPDARPRRRGEHTLGVKRLETGTDRPYGHLEAHVRDLLADQPTFEVRVTGIDYFTEAVTGSSPVVYLSIESPELVALHRRLSAAFEPIDGIEGEGYTPHVTVARGGSLEMAERVVDRAIEPVAWTVTELVFWDAAQSRSISTLSL